MRDFHDIDLETPYNLPPHEPTIPLLKEACAIRDLGERLRFVMDGADGGDRYAQLIEATIVPSLAYAARRVPDASAPGPRSGRPTGSARFAPPA